MTAVQIVRTVGLAMILAALVLGLIPMGPGGACGSGWLERAGYGPGCGDVMAPLGSWALALIAAGATLLVSAWINTPYRPKDRKPQQAK